MKNSFKLVLVLVAMLTVGLTLAACQQTEEVVEPTVEVVVAPTLEEPTVEVITEPITLTEGLTLTEGITPTEGLTLTEGITTTEGMTDTALVPDMVTVTVVTSDTLGEYLADGEGKALYMYTKDMPNTSTCTGVCAEEWPAFVTKGEAVAGTGVDKLMLSTILGTDGTMHVTYNGWPLYYSTLDIAPGQTNGHEMGETWYLISPLGAQVEAK
jgi:predicted lipoprotein with Yx(FWY)xxD motif